VSYWAVVVRQLTGNEADPVKAGLGELPESVVMVVVKTVLSVSLGTH
jgi:hypothetical protein